MVQLLTQSREVNQVSNPHQTDIMIIKSHSTSFFFTRTAIEADII